MSVERIPDAAGPGAGAGAGAGGGADDSGTVDARNPWIGLTSFTEETRGYFYGREEEVAELARRVQRKLLTVLFGQSGLGKTSILRAGLVPRLRTQGYCPVYVRIDYGRDAPEPADQIKEAIARTARRSGEWTRSGVAVAGESLWEFLHHRDDVLLDEAGKPLIPLLIFDQFEEIFTLAQTDGFGRERAARFVADLADLVENRPPRQLEERLDTDETAAERFDFARSDYRVLIALREDYLAPLEGLKATMPSITQNRLRLAPMTGTQALAAVRRPGKGLVCEEVAAAIVRFVAGGAELANAEVEPSLLSLICRELNDTRLAQGRAEISLDLVDGTQTGILTNFYERSLADQPPAVRRLIEDELLTAGGFRENVAEERLLASFKGAGAAPDTLATLVNRRLLRIEERLDVRRVELTHDVLCGVVKDSRDRRQERERREATERQLAEQRERELAARSALVRARKIAGFCILLAIAAVAAAVVAVVSTQRARRAEAAAQETRTQSDLARTQAEHLLTYLTDNFAQELETFGRLDFVAEIARRQIDYFKALPPGLKSADTTRNAARALVSYAKAKRTLGDVDEAGNAAGEVVTMLEALRAGGDVSEATTIVLARGLSVQGSVFSNRAAPEALPTLQKSVALLKPLAETPRASVEARRNYAEVLVNLGFEQQTIPSELNAALVSLQTASRIDAELRTRDPKDLHAAADYADAGAWETATLVSLGRNAEARTVGTDAIAVADGVLAERPGYRQALHSAQVTANYLALAASNEMRPAEEIALTARGVELSHTMLQLDPRNTVALNNLGVSYLGIGDANWALGRTRESNAAYRQALDTIGSASQAGSWFVLNALWPAGILALHQADMGDADAAQATLAEASRAVQKLRASEPAGSKTSEFASCGIDFMSGTLALARRDAAQARSAEQASIRRVRDVRPEQGFQELFKLTCVFSAGAKEGLAEYLLGENAAAERTLRTALEDRKEWPVNNDGDRRDLAEVSTLLALAVAAQGRPADAAPIIAPVVKFHRDLAARNHGDEQQRFELARTLYAQAMAEPAQRAALLKEAGAILDALPAAMRGLASVRLWRERIGAPGGR